MLSSYHVYFLPFKPLVWLMLVVAGSVICFAETFLLRSFTTGQSTAISVPADMYNLLFWKFCSFFGQHRDPSPAIMLANVYRPQPLFQGILIVSTFWLLGNTFILSHYGAAFNAETLLAFPYRTSYKNIKELENFTLYFLLSGHECSQFLRGKAANAYLQRVCNSGGSHVYPECELVSQMHRDWFFYTVKTVKIKRALRRGAVREKALARV